MENKLKINLFLFGYLNKLLYVSTVMREMITLLLCLAPLVGPALLWKETLKDILYVK